MTYSAEASVEELIAACRKLVDAITPAFAAAAKGFGEAMRPIVIDIAKTNHVDPEGVTEEMVRKYFEDQPDESFVLPRRS